MVKLFLSRRNLLTLLSKLDRRQAGEDTACTIIKTDNQHPTHPQSHASIVVTAIEDDAYYADRMAGEVFPIDEEQVRMSQILDLLRKSPRKPSSEPGHTIVQLSTGFYQLPNSLLP